jgi:hypothetical protein
MASFYEDASLVVIPSGYKTSKIYAEKPTDGSGDLTFTRASGATRVASNGLIEKVRTNLLLRSQEFDNAYWAKEVGGLASAPVVTANAELAPDGTMTAERIVFNLNGSTLSAAISQIASATITITAQENTGSIYLKTTDGTSKVFSMVNPDGSVKTITVTGTYQRFTNTSSDASAGGFRFRLRGGEGTADSASIAAWGAQFESGVATDYIPTTTAAVSVGPVSNVPRLDYLGSSCPRLLLEPQRTNLATYSEQADQYTKVGATIGSNVAVSPDGYTNADSIIEDGSNGPHAFYNFGLGTFTVQAYTASVFAKKGGRDWFVLSFYDGTTDRIAFFNLANGTAGNVSAGATSTITSIGNGWYRCTITATAAATAGGIAIYSANVNGASSYAGTNGLTAGYFYGWQLEAGAYATSYIPTLAASVTRVADAASKTGISSLIGQTEGTLFAEIYPEEFINGSYLGISDGANIANRIIFGFEAGSANSGFFQVYGASGLTGSGLYTRGQRMKVAIGYKSGNSALYVNGNLVDAVTTTFTTTLTKFGFDSYAGTQNFVGRCSQAILFKTRLTNAQMAELTTL